MRFSSIIKTLFLLSLFNLTNAVAAVKDATPTLTPTVAASASSDKNKAVLNSLRAAFSQLGLKIDSATAIAIPDMYELTTNQGIIYTNKTGTYFFSGNLFHIDYNNTQSPVTNLTENTQKKIVLAHLDTVKDEMIIYPAKNEKYVITVFTDTTCGYCHKLHEEMKQYNDLGITVRYLAFPRGGRESSNFDQMSSIWCAPDPTVAFDQAEKGTYDPKMHVSIKSKKSCDDLIMRHYNLGVLAGVSGTPGLILADGTSIPGYQPPKDLLKFLAQHKS